MEFLESHKQINEWAKQFATGDARTAEKLFDYFYPIVYRYIKYRIKDEEASEDVTQEVFLKVARYIKQFDAKRGNFSPWMWQIVRNVLTDHLRSQGRHHEDAASAHEIDLDTYSGNAEYTDEEQDLKKLDDILKKYHPDDQELFRMKYIAGLEYHEIADITKRSVNAVTVATHRIREKIKKDLQDSYTST